MKSYTRVAMNPAYTLDPVDRNNPAMAETATALDFPHELSHKARRALNYLDDTAWLFEYQGRLVVTDESLELTTFGNGTQEAPFGGPRWVGDTFAELEAWLESVADDLN